MISRPAAGAKSFRALSNLRRTGPVALTATTVIVVDQASKAWIDDHLKVGQTGTVLGVALWRTPNPGSLTGLPQWSSVVLVLLCVCLLVGMARASGAKRGLAPAIGLVVGGLLSNQIDRIRTGAVDDFIAANWLPSHPNATNLADFAIGAGGVALTALVLKGTLVPARSPSRPD